MNRRIIPIFLISVMLFSASCSASSGAGSESETSPEDASLLQSADADEESSENPEEEFRVSWEDVTVGPIEDQIYTSFELTPSPVVMCGDTVLSEGIDYTLSYGDNISVGTAAVAVSDADEGADFEPETAYFRIITGDELCDEPEHAEVIGFVNRLYAYMLGRYPTPSELIDNSRRLINGSRSGMAIVNLVVQSTEFASRNLSDEDFVNSFYLGVLGRNADEGGFAGNLALLTGGMSRINLVNSIISAPGGEFDSFCTRAGINLGAGHQPGMPPSIDDGIPSSSYNYTVAGRPYTIHRRIYQYIDDSVFDLDSMCRDFGFVMMTSDEGFTYSYGDYELTVTESGFVLCETGSVISSYEDDIDDSSDRYSVNGSVIDVTINTIVMIEYAFENL